MRVRPESCSAGPVWSRTTSPPGIRATDARVDATASRERYGTTPSHRKNAGRVASKPWSPRTVRKSSLSKSTPTYDVPAGTSIPASASRSRFHAPVAGWSTSKTRVPGNGLR